MRTLTCRALVLTCLALATAGPGIAVAQVNPFGGLPPAQQEETPTTPAPTSRSNADEGLKRWQEVVIFLVGVALIGAIGFAIVKDARKNAPVTEDERAGAHRSSSTAGPRKVQSKAKARKKAKAAKAARRHNR